MYRLGMNVVLRITQAYYVRKTGVKKVQANWKNDMTVALLVEDGQIKVEKSSAENKGKHNAGLLTNGEQIVAEIQA